MNSVNRQFLLAARPEGMIKTTDLQYHEADMPSPGQDQALVKVTHISLDPAMRGWMENRGGYMAPLEIGDMMRAGCIREVVESSSAKLPVGRLVSGSLGMQVWIDAGLLTQRTTILRGFEKLPKALVQLFEGVNTGKLMVCP